MNPEWFGDSYDVVKRFFVQALTEIGYEVFVDPMFTGNWGDKKQKFLNFIGAKCVDDFKKTENKTALFIDPDTGIGKKESSKHVTISSIIKTLDEFELVFSFDQSFSYSRSSGDQMEKKLNELLRQGGAGFFYDSHARFLFASKHIVFIDEIKNALLKLGLPNNRIYEIKST